MFNPGDVVVYHSHLYDNHDLNGAIGTIIEEYKEEHKPFYVIEWDTGVNSVASKLKAYYHKNLHLVSKKKPDWSV